MWLGGSHGGLGLLEHSWCCFHTWKLTYQLLASVSDGEQIVSFAALLLCFLCRFANSLLPFRECRIHPRLYFLFVSCTSFICFVYGIYFSENIQNFTVNALYFFILHVFLIVVQLLLEHINNLNMKCEHSLLAFPNPKWRLPLQTFFIFFWLGSLITLLVTFSLNIFNSISDIFFFNCRMPHSTDGYFCDTKQDD